MSSLSTKSPKTKSPFVYLVHDVRDSLIVQSVRDFLLDLNIEMLTSTEDSRGNRLQCSKFSHDWHQQAHQWMIEASGVICLATPLAMESTEFFFESGIARAKRNDALISLLVGVDSRKFESSPLRESQGIAPNVNSLSGLVERLLPSLPKLERGTTLLQASGEFITRIEHILDTVRTGNSRTQSLKNRKARELQQSSAKLFDDLKHMLRDI